MSCPQWSVGSGAGMPADRIPPAAAHRGGTAGIVSRTIANVLDVTLIIGLLGVSYLVALWLLFAADPIGFRVPTPSRPVMLGAAGALCIGYLTGCWATTGRTWGDHVLGLRVVDRRGRPLRIVPAAARAVLCVVFALGVLWAAGPRRLSIQDITIRTKVIYDWDIC